MSEGPLLLASSAALAVASVVLHFVLEPARWEYAYLRELPAPLRRRLRDVLFATALASYLLPFKLGVPLRVIMIQRYAEVALARTTLTLGIDAALSLAVWLGIATVAASLLAHEVSVWRALASPTVMLWVAVGLLVLLALGIRGRSWLARRTERIDWRSLRPRAVLGAAGMLCVDVLSYGARHAFLLVLVAPDSDRAWTAAAAGIVATFAGIASGLPLGLVGYDASFLLLASLIGIAPSTAGLVILANRALNFGVAALLGAPAAWRLGLGGDLRSVARHLRELVRAKP
jgi:uncharacterized membrane protein YbhN (UPF0104 family)